MCRMTDEALVEMEPKYLPDKMMIPIVVVSVVSSTLSIFGSSCIVYMAFRQLNDIKQRILLIMSVADILLSIATMMSAFLLPSELDQWGAIGSFETCSLVGFTFLMGLSVGAWYNAVLSVYYFTSVRYSYWKTQPDIMKLPWWEIFAHLFSISLPLGINIAAVATGSIAPQEFFAFCFYATYPWGCDEDHTPACERQTWQLVYAFGNYGGAYIGFCVLVGLSSTVALYCTVRTRLKKSNKFRSRIQFWKQRPEKSRASLRESVRSMGVGKDRGEQPGSPNNGKMKQVRTQAILYSVTFVNTYFWLIIGSILNYQYTNEELQERKTEPGAYALQLLTTFFVPLQGFLNFFVYTRLKIKLWRSTYPNRCWASHLKRILAGEHIPQAALAAARRRDYLKQRQRNSGKSVVGSNEDDDDDDDDNEVDVGTQRVGEILTDTSTNRNNGAEYPSIALSIGEENVEEAGFANVAFHESKVPEDTEVQEAILQPTRYS